MLFEFMPEWLRIVLAIVTACIIAYAMTPAVKKFAISIGAIDQPSQRRIHKHPVPRMGGIAIVTGFMISAVLYADLTTPIIGILVGALIIAVMGALDDVYDLNPWLKLAIQIIAAAVAIKCGVVFDGITNPFGTASSGVTIFIGKNLALFLTLGWLIVCTNAINLIDGLDGLACGISAISAMTMLVVSLIVSDLNITVVLACLFGACIGFLPYNFNPAQIFMGDVGSQTLGFILACASTLGLFKLHAAITIIVPLLALAVPLSDTFYAIIRRLSKGQSPFKADKGHFHHKLLALGLSQKQVVAVLYAITGIMGLISILMTESGPALKIACACALFIIALMVWFFVIKRLPDHKYSDTEPDMKIYEKDDEDEGTEA